jgi:hypothetical protein
MTTSAAFTAEEWRSLLEAPPLAGMIVVTASHGGTFKETFAMSKAYAEARALHGQSELLDEIVSSKPKRDHTSVHSPTELRAHGLEQLRAAVSLLESKASPEEVDGYRQFVLAVADRVATAHREDGRDVSPGEADAIAAIADALGAKPT